MLHFITFIFALLLAACAPTPQPAALIINTSTPAPTPTVVTSQSPTLSQPAPRLLTRQPSYANIEDRQPTILLKFDRAMDAESVARALSVDPVTPISVTAYGGVTLTVQTLAPLMPGSSYTFTLGTEAADTEGVRLAEEVIWNYSPKLFTASLTPPTARLAPRPFKIQFTYPVNPASVERALWMTPPLSGTLGWNDKYTQLMFTPTIGYEADTLYVMRFDRTPILDPHDRPLPTLAPVSFVSASAIISHGPTSSGAAPNAAIRVQFDRPMNQASVEAAFHLSPAITGTFVWEENTLIFTPVDEHFNESTDYAVRLDARLLSAQGEAVLRADHGWTFRTAGLPEPVAGFGYGSNIQVLNAAGRRAVQFEIYQTRARTITFTLYALNQAQFLADFALGHQVSYWDEGPAINPEGLPLIGQWSEDPAQAIVVEDYGYIGHLHETHIPADVPPGLYLLQVGQRRVGGQLLVVLTQHSIVVKHTPEEIVAWVTDFAGQPQAEVLVEAMASGGWSVGECRTDAQGLCRLTPNPLNPPMLVMARTPEGVTLAGLNYEWRSDSGSGGSPSRYAASVYTGQPVYVFGDTVHFKAIVRQNADGGLSTPPVGTVVTAMFQRGWGEVVRTIYLTTDEFGAVHSQFQLDPTTQPDKYEPPIYSIVVSVGGERFAESFTVQSGAASDYNVSLTTDAPAYVIGDLMTITGHVQDAAGQPVAGARVNLTQFEHNYYGGHCWFPTCWVERYNTRLTGRTDMAGNVTFYVLAERLYSNQTLALGLTTTAQSQSGSAFTMVTVQERDAVLSLTLPAGNFYAPGQTFDVALSGRTLFDTPFFNAPVVLTLNGWDSMHEDYVAVIQSIEATTDSAGQAVVSLTVAEAGHYQLRLIGHDSRGNSLSTVRDVYIVAEGVAWPGAGRTNPLRLIADRNQYAPGETATVLIESAFSGPALLTLERGTVRRAEVVTLTAPLTRLTLPLAANDAPNVYVTVQAWQTVSATVNADTHASLADAHLYTTQLNLPVLVINKQLTLTLIPDKPQSAPGEAATVHIRVTDANGAPVVAQLSLALTDERAFALNPNAAASLFSAFYHKRLLSPAAYHSQAPDRLLMWDGGGGCGGEAIYPDVFSASFQTSAFWEPDLVTDANGEVTVTLTLPDALVHWRLTATAVTMETQVGEAALALEGQ